MIINENGHGNKPVQAPEPKQDDKPKAKKDAK